MYSDTRPTTPVLSALAEPASGNSGEAMGGEERPAVADAVGATATSGAQHMIPATANTVDDMSNMCPNTVACDLPEVPQKVETVHAVAEGVAVTCIAGRVSN